MPKYVYFFGAGRAEGSSVMRNLLGGKGCELAEMTNLGIPVPPGFTITTQAWVHRQRAGRQWPEGLWEQILKHLERLEQVADARFGDRERPLLVSVRSGARVSMPGMMETILNLGLNEATVEGLAARAGNERFAWDCYRRFIAMFSSVGLGVKREVFAEHLDAAKARLGAAADADVPAGELRKLVQTYQEEIAGRTRNPFSQDVQEQLRLAVDSVFDSWFAKKATEYRRIHRVPEEWGTAVTVMAMVFGNLGDASGTGVGFTRDPRTGEARFYAEFLPNAQGEDVVAGIRTPLPIEALRERMPSVHAELLEIATRLERHYKDMQDIEFTVQEGTLVDAGSTRSPFVSPDSTSLFHLPRRTKPSRNRRSIVGTATRAHSVVLRALRPSHSWPAHYSPEAHNILASALRRRERRRERTATRGVLACAREGGTTSTCRRQPRAVTTRMRVLS